MTRLPLMVIMAIAAYAECRPVTANRILGSDLARADAQFSPLPEALTVGFAPAPGTRRVYSAAELERLGRANGISIHSAAEICFEIPLRQVGEEEAIAAMRRVLPESAELKIVELAKPPVPVGRLEFLLAALDPVNPATPGIQLWHGYVRYAETRKASWWARVAIVVHFTAVVAAKDLPPGNAIDSASLKIETRAGPVDREQFAARIEDVQGRVLKRAVSAGAPIPLAALTNSVAIHRGDKVAVDVESGAAHLQFEAIAETSANEGDMIDLRNPTSGKTFRAKIYPGGKVVLVVAAGQRI